MSYQLKLAIRYFFSRRGGLARFTRAAAVGGIAAGVAALIFAQALSRGFAGEMQKKILTNTAHILIFRQDGAEIYDWRKITSGLERESAEIAGITAAVYQNAILIGREAKSYAVLRTEEPARSDLPPTASHNTADRPAEITLGGKLAAQTGLRPGDLAELITVADNETPVSSRVRVAGIFQTGLYEYDAAWVFIGPADYLRHTQKQVFVPTSLNVSVTDIYRAETVASGIRRKLGEDFEVLSWQEANRPLFAALALEKQIVLAVILLIVFLACLNITTTLALLVGERRQDIAVLRTCGAGTNSLLFIFLAEGALLGLIGIAGGTLFGLLGSLLADRFRLVSLPDEVYSLSHVPLEPAPGDIFLIAAAAFFLALAATLYPALKASRIKPLENLRNQ